MAEKKVYLGSEGPFLYDDAELVDDPDSDWAGEAVRALLTDGDVKVTGTHTVGILGLLDTDDSNELLLSWVDNDSADRTLGIEVGGANRVLDIDEDIKASLIINQEDVDDTPVNGQTVAPVSSNWAYDHQTDNDVHDAEAVNVSELGTATYDDVQDFINQQSQRGTLSGCELSGDDANGNVDVSAGTAICKVSNSANAEAVFIDWDGTTAVALDENITTYFYLDYNGGVPQIVTDTSGALFYDYDHIILGCCFRHGTHVHCMNSEVSGIDAAHRLKMHFFEYKKYHRTSGLVTTGTGTRNLDVTTGAIWAGFCRMISLSFDTSEVDSGTADATEAFRLHDADAGFSANDKGKTVHNTTDDTYTYVSAFVDSDELILDDDIMVDTETYQLYDAFDYWYNTDGGSTWAHTQYATQISNTQYNKQTAAFGLQSLVSNRYGVHWVYTDAEGEHIFVVYGQGSYTANEAEEALIPAVLPPVASGFGILVAKIVCQEGTDDMTISYPWTETFTSVLATNHDLLGGLDGGTVDEYYHLTAAEYTEVNEWLDNVTLGSGGLTTIPQLVLAPRAEKLSAVEGGMFYDSDDDKLKVCTVAA